MPRGVPGPVVGVKKTAKAKNYNKARPKRPDQIGGGVPGPGRPKGVPNKFTGELKQTILDAMSNISEDGLFGFIRDSAKETPTAGLSLLGRLIPVNMAGALDLQLTVRHVDETAEDSQPLTSVEKEPEVRPVNGQVNDEKR